MTFQEKLIELRKKKGFSQEELAEQVGVSRQSVSKWETGQSNPDISKLILLSEIFEVSVDTLVKDQDKDEEKIKQESPKAEASSKVYRVVLPIPQHYEYKSKRTIGRLPLVHINFGFKGEKAHAKGLIALGNKATGVFSLGLISTGVFSVGLLSIGLFSLGALSIGLLLAIGGFAAGFFAVGGMAVGVIAVGGLAIGMFATGGGAIASDIAIGGSARGHIAAGEATHGDIIIKRLQSLDGSYRVDTEALRSVIVQEYENLWPPLKKILFMLYGV